MKLKWNINGPEYKIRQEGLKVTSKTHVYEVVIVSDKQIPQYSGLMQVSEADHVLDALDGGRVHCLDATLGRQPELVAVIVNNLYLSSVRRDDPGADGHVKLLPGGGLDPDVVALKQIKNLIGGGGKQFSADDTYDDENLSLYPLFLFLLLIFLFFSHFVKFTADAHSLIGDDSRHKVNVRSLIAGDKDNSSFVAVLGRRSIRIINRTVIKHIAYQRPRRAIGDKEKD